MSMTDSKGKQSKTLMFVTMGILILSVRYALGGLDFGMGAMPVTTATEYGIAFAAILAPWLTREWKEAHYSE